MNKRTHKIIFFLLLVMGSLLFTRERAVAQQITNPQGMDKTERDDSSGVSTQDGRVSIKLERGGHVAVDNRTTGRIRVIGWDRDTVEAVATSERGIEIVRFAVKDAGERVVWLKADYLKREGDDPPTGAAMTPGVPSPPTPDGVSVLKQIPIPGASKDDEVGDPPMRDGRPLEVHLEVHVPRYAEIDLIRVIRSNVEVTNVETPIIVLGSSSTVVLKHVGEVEVRTRSGSVEIEDVAGLIEATTTSGPISVKRAGGDVRVLSISGNIGLECVRGRVNVDSANGTITLNNVQGDVEANASNSNIFFTGAIRKEGRYHLKTMSGAVEMSVRDKPPGFTAALSSYRGTIENDFQLQVKSSSEQQQEGDTNRRIVGRLGDGKAQITLDSFDGKVKLAKISPGVVTDCK